jgi:hypothetical protein
MNFKTFFLGLIIIVSGLFIYLKTMSLGDENSYFNQNTRYQLGKYGWVRTLLGLRKDGDARAEYLIGDGAITVEIVKPNNVIVDQDAIDGFLESVEAITGRKTIFYNTDTIKGGKLSDEDLKSIIRKNRRHRTPGSPNLFIIYSDDFSTGGEVGRTYQEFGILLSGNRLNELTSNYPAAKTQYIQSTLLHEFGHQIGLLHNEDLNCVMNAAVESPRKAQSFSGAFTPVEFCPIELDELNGIKQALK